MKIKYMKNQTEIVNIKDISDCLKRTVSELLKMFSYHLGTSVNIKNRLILGLYDFECLHKHLLNYIEKYILCNYCNNPETIYILIKNSLYLKCCACPGNTKINDQSNLKDYITRNITKTNENFKNIYQ